MTGRGTIAVVRGSEVDGTVRAPPSKSLTQRAVACALIADGRTEVVNPSTSDDGTVAAMVARSMGARVRMGDGVWTIDPPSRPEAPEDVVDCGGSATSMRLFTAIAALADGATVLTGNRSLRRRPIGELLEALGGLGVHSFSTRHNGLPPVVVEGGGIRGGTVSIRGDVSSQYISALILACTRADSQTSIQVLKSLESADYVMMSLDVLREFGGIAGSDFVSLRFKIPGRQALRGCRLVVEGDYSSAAFVIAAGALAGRASVTGLKARTSQGDRRILEIIERMGGRISVDGCTATATRNRLMGVEIDCSEVPDLVPVLGVLATQAEGVTVFRRVSRLRIKESDRVEGVVSMINRLGGRAKAEGDDIIVKGPSTLRGTEIDPREDHRIAMAAAVAGLVASGETVIRGAECVSKSYPGFFSDLKDLGAGVEVIRG
ncbi:MAG: 3-phosphoshikimate 1-carboxyvinyltransferase [Candidatus Methanosuratus sp.]|nr:3-phosphoshikimate 1-carboxyvinyltransferase [Candidatus Methanosuratincola sp.]